MDVLVSAAGSVSLQGRSYRCALGRSGVSGQKEEGDGATPAGRFSLRQVLFRRDRLARPPTSLEARLITPEDGWCDDPGDPAHYNRPVRVPHPSRAERLWRADGLYDVIGVLGYNDDPVVPGAGSAIFFHVADPEYRPTEGCIALALPHLLLVLRECTPATRVCIMP